MSILITMTRMLYGGFFIIACAVPVFSFAAFQPVQIITRPGIVTAPLKFDLDIAGIPMGCVNPDIAVVIAALNAEKTAVRFEAVQLYDQLGAPIGINVASKTDALSQSVYSFTFRNFGITAEQLATVKGIQISFLDLGGENPTGFVKVAGVQASVTCSVGAACVVSNPITLSAPVKPPATLAGIQGERKLISRGAAVSASGGGGSTPQGPNSPASMSDDATTGTLTWLMVDNAKASDNAYSTVTNAGVSTSHYLKALGFSFSIPTGATINGITAEVEKRQALSGSITDNRVRIVKSGIVGSTDKASASAWPTVDVYTTYGSSSDTWGEVWTASDINNNGTFGLVISIAVNTGAAASAYVDHVRMTVSYTEGGASVYDSFMDVFRSLFRALKF